MSDTVIEVVGEIMPPMPESIKIAVVEFSGSEDVELREGDKKLARLKRTSLGEWLVSIELLSSHSFEGFYVTNRSEGIDALSDFGRLYHAAKTGEFK
ncbi:hypothetical protein [Mycobacteroides immunogenum]|uniref:Uncharacterized protein n=1 Tax=Mycobacteroides immunogenum TaxID=83262 RepID=A0A7V8RU41_9MYCO|nr:hypothetical protein [Mycobacteroides immunogenum]AMT71943.1 hypothetical protein ABG82_18245 [Mycobacteroides immunogenum]ANO05075.1 hypothetical protein BAB75_18530 [Mycobacteroides immunogenum]KIU40251.1 hypothetical protein TL11_13435 [Mycobacteroides immunogenum]KPG02839.1 hypothetical protein AN909_26395 [Mycobacteroides immunogenum]KPG02927.1 hypothetical protein AN908_26845 [Mycobacteroides immunogenum]